MQRIIFIMLAVIAASAVAMAEPLPGDHVIVPGVRIGAAELVPADQGALQRTLGEPDRTDRAGDHEYYRYGADELVIDFDLANDAPFEISTASPSYRTREGLGVGSSADQVRARLGQPLCESESGIGAALIGYHGIRFLLSRNTVTRVSVRAPDSAETLCR